MPIKDYDATTNYDIKEVRDYDATTNYIIKEVRDYDATSNYVIYTASTPEDPSILNYSDQKTAVTGGWGLQTEGGYEYLRGYLNAGEAVVNSSWPAGWYFSFNGENYYGRGWMTTKNKIAISGYSKLKLTCFYQKGYGDSVKGAGYVYVALVNNSDYAGGNVTSNIMQGSNVYKSKVVYCNNNSGTVTVELDVSGVEGSYYVQIGRWNYNAYYTFTSGFQTVVFE